jgi:hypothetical protein
MAPQAVPLTWSGQFLNFAGPLASGDSDSWLATGTFGQENRFYVFSAFSDGTVAAELEVQHVSHYRRSDGGSLVDETHFEVHNRGSAEPVTQYYVYIAWSDPVNVWRSAVRIQVEYDGDGRITAVAGVVAIEHSDGSVSRASRVARPSHYVLEVDTDEMSHERDTDGLRRILDSYLIAGHPREPKLIRRDTAGWAESPPPNVGSWPDPENNIGKGVLLRMCW